jgi:microcystin degradation protein MlrC
LITSSGVFGQFIRQAKLIEQSPGGLSAGMFIGNPFTDVPELRCYSVVTTDNDPALAEREAIRLAEGFWSERQRMQAKLTPLAQGVREAAGLSGTVALVDAADATSSGAAGDSNAILRELLAQNYSGRALVPIVDPAAVQTAFEQGVGAVIETTVGGGLDRRRFTPLPIQATVRMLSDGRFRSESFNQEWCSGRTAVLQAGAITLVVTSRPVHLFDRSLFYAHGQSPRDFHLVVVKSPHCQHHMYAEWCTRLINVDAPGSTSANLPTLGHTRCRRPVFPLDEVATYAPTARLFSRRR